VATLLLRFVVSLIDYEESRHEHINGPLFHRWLPDGENDAIALETGNPDVELKIWFERRGFVDNSFVKYDNMRHEVDPDVMVRQGKLEAGHLRGSLVFDRLSDEELRPILENKLGEPRYVALGRRIVQDTLFPRLSQFISILRVNYGQYWLPELPAWDSRYQTLGDYCYNELHLEWTLPGGSHWAWFTPDESGWRSDNRGVEGLEFSYAEYITQADWEAISQALRTGHNPSLAGIVLARTHKLLANGDLRYAFVTGVTALEIAIEELMRDKLSASEAIDKEEINRASAPFKNLKIPPKLVIASSLLGTIDPADIVQTLQAIEIRNDIIHDAEEPSKNSVHTLTALMRVASQLLPNQPFKKPLLTSTNALRPDWETGRAEVSIGHSARTEYPEFVPVSVTPSQQAVAPQDQKRVSQCSEDHTPISDSSSSPQADLSDTVETNDTDT
jgi:hypothetical protein